MEMRLKRLLDSEIGRGHCHEAALCVMRGDAAWTAAAGSKGGADISADTPFLIASTSKLFVTAMILQLADAGHLRLDDPVERFFPGELAGLHMWKGVDLTPQITLRHLLTHSSGLPDYFEDRRRDGTRMTDRLFAGQDAAFGLSDVLTWCREGLRAHFAPGHGRRAHYSDTNFYLLTEVVTRVMGVTAQEALERQVTGPLGLTRTAFYQPGMEVMPLRYGSQVLDLSQTLASMPGDGGAVSTARELAIFIRAFHEGRLFDRAWIARLADWRRVFFPIQAGLGVLRFHQPVWLPPFQRDLDFIGHSGIIGAFAFTCPGRGLFLAGTVNQLKGRSRPYRLMAKAALAVG
jgi:D-alanyl-D-alanine carboxypeptidase